MKVHHYYPGFVDPGEDEVLDFEIGTLEELFAFEWITRWKTHPGFREYMYSPGKNGNQLLLAVGTYPEGNKPYRHLLAILEEAGLEDSTLAIYVEQPLGNQVS